MERTKRKCVHCGHIQSTTKGEDFKCVVCAKWQHQKVYTKKQ